MPAEPARSPHPARSQPSGVVRPLSRAAHRRCARPGCPTPARVTLSFQYEARRAVLAALAPDARPETYDLCAEHADRTHPPYGWTLHDRRPEDDDDVMGTPDADDLASPRTVALLAAALRGTEPTGPEGTDVPAADDPVAAAVDVQALDAITAEPFDEPADLDLLASPDEVAAPTRGWSGDALHELSALAEDPPVEPKAARTVPGARRPD